MISGDTQILKSISLNIVPYKCMNAFKIIVFDGYLLPEVLISNF